MIVALVLTEGRLIMVEADRDALFVGITIFREAFVMKK